MNHQSYYDSFGFIGKAKQPLYILAKKEISSFPLIGHVATFIDCQYIDRGNMRQSLKVVQSCTELLKQGKRVLVCPEGTRTRDGQIHEFKSGAFKMALDSMASIIPVVIHNSNKALKTKFSNRKNPIYLSFLPPIPYSEFSELNNIELARLIEEKVKQRYNELLQEIKS
jgi:1-acyl-sn-glycerol-3-phosphate acyltransferase